MKRTVATWDSGWVGKGIHSPARMQGSGESPETPTVEAGGEEKPLLYVEEDGIWYGLWRKGKAGF